MENKEKKALIAMSGGVDSSVAAYIMKDNGYDCVGVTMKLYKNDNFEVSGENTCCSLDDVEDARRVADALDMPFYVVNFAEKFKEEVIERFIAAYEAGETPNPCIECNRHMKFERLYNKARELGLEYVVTGHYARCGFDEKTGRYFLKKAVDETKDQSYVLYAMTQEQLAHTIFPLGGMTKLQVRELAESRSFVNARKHDSQDICFVPDGKYADFIESYTGKTYKPGSFMDKSGKVLGTHKGIIRYTIGQRKGLGLALECPMYVCDINVDTNTVTLCKNEELFSKKLTANKINLISVEKIEEPMRVKAKIRYSHREEDATVIQTGDDEIKIEFDNPQRAITKGQAVVMYDGDNVIGGGVIKSVD